MFVSSDWHVLKPGTPEHPGTLEHCNTPEHRNTPEQPNTWILEHPEHRKIPENAVVQFLITDHVIKVLRNFQIVARI